MLQPDAFREAETYTQQQERTLGFVPDDELGTFVISSIERLALEHIQPLTHAVSETIEQTGSSWLRFFLDNGADNVMIDPPIKNALPARYSRGNNLYNNDDLLLLMDGGLLKIKTGAPIQEPRNDVLMIIARYATASKEEVASLTAKRAQTGNPVDPNATIIMVPRTTVEYHRRSHYGNSFACMYWDRSVSEAIDFHSSSEDLLPPDKFKTMHQAFMREARVALSALRSALAQ